MADFARSTHPGVQAQLDKLSRLSPAGDRLGLERITAILDRLGNPQDRLPPVFHVAGTNGKGSTVAFLRAALEASGHSVHAFTSPHLVRFNERIRVAGRLIDDQPLADLLGEVLEAGARVLPSFFEVATAVAMLAFARTHADACILEVGLGGRLDSTNVIERPLVTGIADLALDHQQFLGTGLADIAAEKAAIAKAGVPLLTQLYPPAAARRVEEIANQAGAIWLPRGQSWEAIVRQRRLRYGDERGVLDLPHCRAAGTSSGDECVTRSRDAPPSGPLRISNSALTASMGWADWPARLQHLARGPLVGDREVWLDGGHNPSAARQVASYIKRTWIGGKPVHLIFASLTTKDPVGMLKPFAGVAKDVHAVPISGHACFDPDDLVDVAANLGFSARPHDSIEDALSAIPQHARVLIFGSLYLAGEVLAANGQIPD